MWTNIPILPLFLDKLWLCHLWRTSFCEATTVCSAVFNRSTGNLEFLTSIWLCSCLGVIYENMSVSFKSMKILPKLDISVVPVRETQASSSENCTTSICRECHTDFLQQRKDELEAVHRSSNCTLQFVLFFPQWPLVDRNISVKVLLCSLPHPNLFCFQGYWCWKLIEFRNVESLL